MDNIIIRDLNTRISKLETTVEALTKLLGQQTKIITALTNNMDKLVDRVNTNTHNIDVANDNTMYEVGRVWQYLRGE